MNMPFLKKLFSACRKILPLPCPLCRKHDPEEPNGFCKDCLTRLELLAPDETCCPGCGGKMTGALAVCDQCIAEPERPWQKAHTLMPYRKYAKSAIRSFKFHNRPELARPFGILLAEKIIASGIKADLVMAIPLHFMRQFTRGYNQSQLLAEIVSVRCNIPHIQALKRIRKRSHQARRNRNDRHRELAGSFILKSKESVRDRHILLIDDVLTTGATLHAATETLLAGKPASVTVITLARTPGHSAF